MQACRLKDPKKQVQYYGIRDPEEIKQALEVFGGGVITICEYSLPDLDSNGDVYERMDQKLNNHFVPRKNKYHARFRLAKPAKEPSNHHVVLP